MQALAGLFVLFALFALVGVFKPTGLHQKIKINTRWKAFGAFLLAVIISGALGSASGNSSATKPSAEPVSTQKEATKPAPKPEPPKNEPTINLNEFNQIKNGMTYDEVVKIIGGKGTLQSEAGDGQFKTEMYTWKADNGIANANVTFQGGKVIGKAQIGLQ